MEVRNCKKCGRLFNYLTGQPICPACRDAQEEEFQKVKAYIQEHTKVNIAQVAIDCEVTESQIRNWIRQERLVFSDDSPVGINCENCGKSIRTGRFCEACKNEIARGLSNNFKKEEVTGPVAAPVSSSSNKMRYLNR